MRLLILGSNAFSASHFIAHALQHEVEILAISRSKFYHDCFIPYDWQNKPQLRFVQLDINQDFEQLTQLTREFKPNLVANFAAQGMVAQSWENPNHWYNTNILSSVAFVEWLKTQEWLERYLQISTPEVYGSQTKPIEPCHIYMPSTPYAISKASLDQHLKISCEHQDFPVVFVRSANFYGPGQGLYRVVPKAFLTFLSGQKFYLQGKGASIRSFIYVQDVVEGYWQALTQGSLGGIYHFASADMISIKSLVEHIAQLCEVDPEQHIQSSGKRLGQDKAYTLSTQHTQETIGWSIKTQLNTGLSNVYAWVRKHQTYLETLPWDYIHKI